MNLYINASLEFLNGCQTVGCILHLCMYLSRFVFFLFLFLLECPSCCPGALPEGAPLRVG